MPSRQARAKAQARAQAKARAAAKLEAKNRKRSGRRAAIAALNALAEEVGAARAAVDPRAGVADDVKVLVTRLQPRCQDAALFQRLREATEAYVASGGCLALEDAPDLETPSHVGRHKVLKVDFRLHSSAFMLTYNSVHFRPADWTAFRTFVVRLKTSLGARAWAACLEQSLHSGAAGPDRFHTHAYLIWTDGVGMSRDGLDDFLFRSVRPRVDVCTAGRAPSQEIRRAALHGLWYVAVAKAGTIHADTNYAAGLWYKPSPQWLDSLYQDGKLLPDQFISMSATFFPLGHAARKRDVDEALRDSRRHAVQSLVQKELAELDSQDALRPIDLARFPDVHEFVESFRVPKRRRPVVVLLGPTGVGKSLFAGQILRRVCDILQLPDFLEVTVEDDGHMDFSEMDPSRHGGVLLDGLGDVMLLKQNRESLQGRPKELKGAKSQTMRFAYPYTLARRAVVLTMDLSAANIHMLTADHWLSEKRNVVLVRLRGPAWEPEQLALPTRREDMAEWSVRAVGGFLKGEDLEGPAAALAANGVRGRDFLSLDEKDLVDDLRLSRFAARRTVAARDAFLEG